MLRNADGKIIPSTRLRSSEEPRETFALAALQLPQDLPVAR